MVIKTTMRYTPFKTVIKKRQIIIYDGKDVMRLETLRSCLWEYKMLQLLYPKKKKNFTVP